MGRVSTKIYKNLKKVLVLLFVVMAFPSFIAVSFAKAYTAEISVNLKGEKNTVLTKTEVLEYGSPSFMTEYEFDKNCNPTKSKQYTYDAGEQKYTLVTTVEFEYDKKGNLLSQTNNFSDGSKRRNSYTRDKNNQITVLIEEDWNKDESKFVFNRKTLYTYDSLGDTTSIERISYENGEWVNSDKQATIYTAQGNILNTTFYTWDKDNQKYENRSKTENVYDGNGRVTESSSYWWLGDEWNEDSKYTYEYDANGNKTQQKFYSYKQLNDVTTYSYDTNNRLTAMIISEYVGGNSQFVEKEEYSYDGEEFSSYYTYNGSDWDYQSSRKQIQSKTDKYGNVVEVKSMVKHGDGEWQEETSRINTYVPMGKKAGKCFIWLIILLLILLLIILYCVSFYLWKKKDIVLLHILVPSYKAIDNLLFKKKEETSTEEIKEENK